MSNRDIGADTDTNTGQVYQYTETEHRGGGGGEKATTTITSFRFIKTSVQFSSTCPPPTCAPSAPAAH